MCDQRPIATTETTAWQAVCKASDHALALGSRRRRLWELDDHAYCPVVGVCLSMPALHRIADKTMHGWRELSEYDLHCMVVTASKTRGIVAEAVHKELEKRYAASVRAALKAKTTEALAAYWQAEVEGDDLAGALWATLTHARCTPALEKTALGQVHMIQHQVGMAVRVDLAAHETLQYAHSVLQAQHLALMDRQTRHTHDTALRHEALMADIVRLRAEIITRDTAVAAAHADLEALRASIPDFKPREALNRHGAQLEARVAELERTLKLARDEAERERRRADALAAETHQRATAHAPATTPPVDLRGDDETMPDLRERAVLCVGGRTAIVPIYRQLVERSGGRFMHHDGGEEQSHASLDATLTAADLVICQTGCISHNAYWRVKSHCKRTGKRCVFTDTPSMTGLKRALGDLSPPSPAVEDHRDSRQAATERGHPLHTTQVTT